MVLVTWKMLWCIGGCNFHLLYDSGMCHVHQLISIDVLTFYARHVILRYSCRIALFQSVLKSTALHGIDQYPYVHSLFADPLLSFSSVNRLPSNQNICFQFNVVFYFQGCISDIAIDLSFFLLSTACCIMCFHRFLTLAVSPSLPF